MGVRNQLTRTPIEPRLRLRPTSPASGGRPKLIRLLPSHTHTHLTPSQGEALGRRRRGGGVWSNGLVARGGYSRVRGLRSRRGPPIAGVASVPGASRAAQLPSWEVRVSPNMAACRTLADNGCVERSIFAETNTISTVSGRGPALRTLSQLTSMRRWGAIVRPSRLSPQKNKPPSRGAGDDGSFLRGAG